ncbi:MAG: hypothetical protein JO345_15560 [Streptosporangiaceae bacterium]|nr:hypothetical protein [Streptosporangiaceae bacterium]
MGFAGPDVHLGAQQLGLDAAPAVTLAVAAQRADNGVLRKNPIYHIGKIYSVLADVIACEITTATSRASTVHLVSQSGRDLRDPWLCAAALAGEPDEQARAHIDRIVEKRLAEVELLSDEIIRGAIPGLR